MARGGSRKGRRLSAATRAKMSASATARWARERELRDRVNRQLQKAASQHHEGDLDFEL